MFPEFFRLPWIKFSEVGLLSTPQIVHYLVPVLPVLSEVIGGFSSLEQGISPPDCLHQLLG